MSAERTYGGLTLDEVALSTPPQLSARTRADFIAAARESERLRAALGRIATHHGTAQHEAEAMRQVARAALAPPTDPDRLNAVDAAGEAVELERVAVNVQVHGEWVVEPLYRLVPPADGPSEAT